MIANFILRRHLTLSLTICLLLSACGESEQSAIQSYLKQMTEVAVTIENTRGQEGAVSAASHIAEMNTNINNLVSQIRSLPQAQQDQIMQQHHDSIIEINQRITSALSELALRDAQARRTISDELRRLDRL